MPCAGCDAAYYSKRIAVIEPALSMAYYCLEGYYGRSTVGRKQTNILCSGACPAGRICPHKGQSSPQPVQPGSYTGRRQQPMQDCPFGHYCAGNTIDPMPRPAGTLGDVKGLNSSSCNRPLPERLLLRGRIGGGDRLR